MMHILSTALRLALRELRSGLQGFRIFLACLILGVSAIAVVGALSSALNTGIADEGRSLMGGDIEFSTLYDTPSSDQRSFIAAAGRVSKVATVRAMAAVPDQSSALVEVKVVDGAYPLYGKLQLKPEMPLSDALQRDASGRDGTVVETALLARLDVKVGDIVRVGTSDLVINAAIVREPDRISDGFVLGPRLMISTDALAPTGLARPGSLINWRYRVALPQPANDTMVKQLVDQAGPLLQDQGWKVLFPRERGTRRAPFHRPAHLLPVTCRPDIAYCRRCRRGKCGQGVSGTAHQKHCNTEMPWRICAPGVLDLFHGGAHRRHRRDHHRRAGRSRHATAGSGIAVGPAADPGISRHRALAGHACSLVRLSDRDRIRGMAAGARRAHPAQRPVPRHADQQDRLARTCVMAGYCRRACVHLHPHTHGIPGSTRHLRLCCRRIVASFAILTGMARLMMWIAARTTRARSAVMRLAIANLHRPGTPTPSVVLSLGLGLTLFVSLALVDSNISKELRDNLPDRAPSFFFLDVHSSEADQFGKTLVQSGASTVSRAPMLRGRIVKVNGVPAGEVKVSADAAWALRGDRGITYSATAPEGGQLTEGEWWPADYSGKPLVSFSADIAEGVGARNR